MASIGHVHLKVHNLAEAEKFYSRFLGLEVVERIGAGFSFLSGGEHHHDVALQHVGAQAPVPQRHAVGLFHAAFQVADKRAFAETYQAFKEANIPVFTTDHRIAWALYSADPSGNGVEVYVDVRREADGAPLWEGQDRPLGEAKILAELTEAVR